MQTILGCISNCRDFVNLNKNEAYDQGGIFSRSGKAL